MAAAYARQTELLKLILGKTTDVNAKDKSGFTALMVASGTGNVKTSSSCWRAAPM
jgi:ankyrin repeat protein